MKTQLDRLILFFKKRKCLTHQEEKTLFLKTMFLVDFSIETMEPRKEWNGIFKILKKRKQKKTY